MQRFSSCVFDYEGCLTIWSPTFFAALLFSGYQPRHGDRPHQGPRSVSRLFLGHGPVLGCYRIRHNENMVVDRGQAETSSHLVQNHRVSESVSIDQLGQHHHKQKKRKDNEERIIFKSV